MRQGDTRQNGALYIIKNYFSAVCTQKLEISAIHITYIQVSFFQVHCYRNLGSSDLSCYTNKRQWFYIFRFLIILKLSQKNILILWDTWPLKCTNCSESLNFTHLCQSLDKVFNLLLLIAVFLINISYSIIFNFQQLTLQAIPASFLLFYSLYSQ